MAYLIKRALSGVAVPFIVTLLFTVILWKWPFFKTGFHQIRAWHLLLGLLPILPYVFFLSGAILSIRYTQTGFTVASLFLTLSYFLVTTKMPVPLHLDIRQYLALLLPLNLIGFSFLKKRKLLTIRGSLYWLPILIEILVVGFLIELPCKGKTPFSLLPWTPLPDPFAKQLCLLSTRIDTLFFSRAFAGNPILTDSSIVMSLICLIVLLIRFMKTGSPVFTGFLGILITGSLGITLSPAYPAAMIYFTASGVILIISAIEVSFSLAYIDDLTRLPGRRSLNEAMVNLGGTYAIAMVDVDHFKKFNDTYGHDTGDQVLKMIAAHFSKLTGGAKTFRYGGEEFTAIFPGKSIDAALPHLEHFRKSIESSPFFVRGKGRPGAQKRGLARRKSSGERNRLVRVTVSIGVSEPSKLNKTPDKVIKNADKALYRAKKAGRNRVML